MGYFLTFQPSLSALFLSDFGGGGKVDFNLSANIHKISDIPHLNVKNIIQETLLNPDLQVYISDLQDFTLTRQRLENLILQVYLQVWDKSSYSLRDLIIDVVKVFLTLRKNTSNAGTLLNVVNLNSLYKLRRYILDPAISADYIKMIIPDKPTSSKQGYELSQMGLSLFE